MVKGWLELLEDLEKLKPCVSALNISDILLNLILVGSFGFLAIASWRGGGTPQQVKLIELYSGDIYQFFSK